MWSIAKTNKILNKGRASLDQDAGAGRWSRTLEQDAGAGRWTSRGLHWHDADHAPFLLVLVSVTDNAIR